MRPFLLNPKSPLGWCACGSLRMGQGLAGEILTDAVRRLSRVSMPMAQTPFDKPKFKRLTKIDYSPNQDDYGT
eukprot:450900-Amphidinium_carterae.1